jgi:putative SOS response-associated peptidase YedK
MCGRFSLFRSRDEIATALAVEMGDLPPRYNITPSQEVAAVRLDGGQRRLSLLRWGLIPSWAEDPRIGNSLINARSETAATKPAFRSAFKARRCLLPADGFYEWGRIAGTKHEQPFHFRLHDGRPFVFAGLWERWAHGEGEPVETCTILTTTANGVVRPVHDRMPVILAPDGIEAWLDTAATREELEGLLRPYAEGEMEAVPVGRFVNNPRNEGPHCLAS